MNITVVGLGHIGLPLAAQYASKGHRVLGCDINAAVVDMVNRGESYPEEAALGPAVSDAVQRALLTARTDTSKAVSESDVVVVIVPLVVDDEKRIDYKAIDSATRDVAAGLKPGTLVIYETTMPVGDTRNRFGAALESGSGLQAGRDFSLAFSPERVYVGRVFDDLRKYPKVVGGIDAESERRAHEFYSAVLDADILSVGTTETAEFVKLAETTYRDVNIALANEFAKFAEEVGVDVVQAIQAANTQPFSHIHAPGAGVGGHCIPVYPYFYANNATSASLAFLSRDINDNMAQHLVRRLADTLGDLSGRHVGVLGFSYRENVKEDAFTIARAIVRELTVAGATVSVHDPFYTGDELRAKGLVPLEFPVPDALDAVVVQAAHREYQTLNFGSIPGLKAIVDGRNAISRDRVPVGIAYIGVGRA